MKTNSHRIIAVLACLCLSLLLLGNSALQDDDKKPVRFVGKCSLEDVLKHDQEYADATFIYIPNQEAVDVFKAVSKPVTIKLFYRTDCPDSVREVPPFIKTIQLAANDNITVEVIGVNKAKDKPADLIKGWDLRFVPTFIVVHDNKEIGRVIETAEDKIEVDLANFLKKIL